MPAKSVCRDYFATDFVCPFLLLCFVFCFAFHTLISFFLRFSIHFFFCFVFVLSEPFTPKTANTNEYLWIAHISLFGAIVTDFTLDRGVGGGWSDGSTIETKMENAEWMRMKWMEEVWGEDAKRACSVRRGLSTRATMGAASSQWPAVVAVAVVRRINLNGFRFVAPHLVHVSNVH